MSRTGVTHTDTASGKGGGQLTENPAPPSPEGGSRPKDEQPAPFSGEMHDKASDLTEQSSDQPD